MLYIMHCGVRTQINRIRKHSDVGENNKKKTDQQSFRCLIIGSKFKKQSKVSEKALKNKETFARSSIKAKRSSGVHYETHK